MSYRVYRFDISMTKDQDRLERFLNRLEGEVVAIIPNITWFPKTQVDFFLCRKVGLTERQDELR